jgi:hypothetical protein
VAPQLSCSFGEGRRAAAEHWCEKKDSAPSCTEKDVAALPAHELLLREHPPTLAVIYVRVLVAQAVALHQCFPAVLRARILDQSGIFIGGHRRPPTARDLEALEADRAHPHMSTEQDTTWPPCPL